MKAPRRHVIVGFGAFCLVVGLVGLAMYLILSSDDSQAQEPPVRVLLIGDSIMNQAGVYLEGSLEDLSGLEVGIRSPTGETPADAEVEIRDESENGTGLLTPSIHDWVAEAPALVEEYQPDVIAVLFVGNYSDTDLWHTEGGAEVEGYTDLFFREWETQARLLQGALATSGADIYWVNPPPMLADEGARRVSYFRQIHRGIAEDWTGTVLIDGTDVLANDDGTYAFELPGEDGTLEQVRAIDSVHLTARGSELLADEIARQMVPSFVVQRTSSTPEQ
jgi:hypothetical protein